MLSFPSSPTQGQQYTDTNGKVWEFDGVKWNVATASSIKQFYGAKLYLSNDVFLTSTLTAIEFDSLGYDTGEFYNPTSPSKLTIPRTGYYKINLLAMTGQEGAGASYDVTLKRNTTELFNSAMSAYQSGVYNETMLLNVGDDIELFASEVDSIGTIIVDSFLSVELVGYTFGGALAPGFEFSGVKVTLSTDINTTSTSTPITWNSNDIEFNINANAAGNVYWSTDNPTRFTISTTGYYNIKAFFLTNIDGSSDSYGVKIKKNGATDLETITLGANESAGLDEVYQFSSNDYIETYIENTENLGSIKATSTFFEIIRLGV